MACIFKGYVKGSIPTEIEILVTNPVTGHITTLYLDTSWVATIGGSLTNEVLEIQCEACKVSVSGSDLSAMDDPAWGLFRACMCGSTRLSPRLGAPNTKKPAAPTIASTDSAPPVEPITPEPVDVDAELKKRRDALFARVFNQ